MKGEGGGGGGGREKNEVGRVDIVNLSRGRRR